jgi:hypothetical protein
MSEERREINRVSNIPLAPFKGGISPDHISLLTVFF